MDGLTISISIIALFVSISSFQWNKAKHNLNQLQDNAKKFCDNLQKFIELSTEHNLTVHKFEIENIYHIKDSESKDITYNNLQIEFSKRKDNCQNKYKQLMESLEFFEIQGESSKNELIKWLNKSINEYHLKLNQFYGDLFDINLIVKAAEKGLLTKENKQFVDNFYNNIRDLLDYQAMFSVLKTDISGYFSKLSLVDVGLFGKTKGALIKIENDLMRIIIEFGFENAITKKDYVKISKQCLDFGEQFDEFVKEEK